MRRLTIIGTTPNGDGVILSDSKGAKFLVANDPRLVAVSELDLSRQLEMALQSFSPREIQARVRGGASAEVIAAETGWPLDKVLRYAEPLLAERAYIAEQAQAVEVRRSGGGATLLEAAAAALDSEPEYVEVAWDAWRREDGKWVITATYQDAEGPQSAQWTYDHAGRNLHPLDDQARILMGARRTDRSDAISDALELIADRPAALIQESEAARPRLMAVPDAADDEETGGESPATDHSSETITIPHPSASEAPADSTAESPVEAPTPKPAARKPKQRKGRASVPSWDEILFGAKTDE